MIKKIIPVIALIFLVQSAKSQSCKGYLGTKTLYAVQHVVNTPPPKGYIPVFINHVGRHGARHLTKDVNTTFIYSILQKAEAANGLTDLGKSLKEKIWKLEKVEKKDFKSISAEGRQEQRLIADRMFANYKQVFNEPNPVFTVNVTKEIRTSQTGEAFLDELQTKINKPEVTKQVNDTMLRFYDLSPVYQNFKGNGNWNSIWEKLKTSLGFNSICNNITQRFFISSFSQKLLQKEKEKFTTDLFGFITIFFSIEAEIKENGFTANEIDMSGFLTCHELSVLGKIDNAEEYLVKGPSYNSNGIQVKIAVPLLTDFIRTTDSFIKTGSTNAQFRFAHAETISPFATLMEITSASKATYNASNINKIWKAGDIIPLSANIQWILYKKEGSENYLVKFLLNEKEVRINGLVTKTFPYYKWSDVRNFYIKKLKNLNSSLGENGLKYLQSVK